MKSILAGFGLIALTDAFTVTDIIDVDPSKTAEAVFSENDITGTVTIDNGYIVIDLDLSAEPNLPGGYSACVSGGLKYHIHMKWDHDDLTDKINGTDCGADYTGGHWDPWHGCGSASGNAYCSNKGGCINVSDYSASFSTDVFSAEVGDWNGKYGLATVDSDGTISSTDSSFWEVGQVDVGGMSVVFHCNGGSRAFCAPFVESSDDASYMVPDQDGTPVMADFSAELSDDSVVYLFPDGDVEMTLDASDVTDSTGCSEWSYGIFNATGTTMSSAAVGEDCESYVGDLWDPTHQCPTFSGSEYCNATGYLCSDAAYDYDCDFANDRYSCAPGDLSGKFGKMDDYEFSLSEEGPRTLIPKTDDMVDMVFAIYCGDYDSGISYLACAPIESYDTTTPAPNTDGAVERTVILAMVSTIFAMVL